MNGESLTPEQQKLEALKAVLPEAFTEGKIDWEKLKATLGEDINFSNERYVLNWAGKSEAFKVLQAPTTKTLIPAKNESVEFDNTEHVFIEGENLEVLKVLQKSYFGKVKMIYIDPPYNTGNDSFIYPDKFSETIAEYEKRVGDKDEDGYLTKDGLFRKNSKENGQYHSNWLNMMMPRLYLAKNLLKPDGVIFISIDDNEVHNLRLLMNEVFGEENFLFQVTVLCNPKGRSQDKYIANSHEYLIGFSKKTPNKGDLNIPKSEKEIAQEYKLKDTKGNYRELELRNTHREFGRHNRKNLFYPFYVNEEGLISLSKLPGYTPILPIWEDGFEGCWTWGLDKSRAEIDKITVKEIKGNWKVYRKNYAKDESGVATKQVKSIWMEKQFHTDKGQAVFNELLNTKSKIFQSPKPLETIKNTLLMGSDAKSIVLDFFTGSATTAHAVMALNAEDGGNRKCISVQLPELCDEKSEAFKAGYQTIADIAKERIRRAGKKIQAENPDYQGDIGFKVLKLAESNFKQWQQVEGNDLTKIKEQMEMFIDPVAEGATLENMAYELMLKSGFDLNSTLELKEGFYTVNQTALVLLLESATQAIIDTVIALKPEKVIALDKLFKGNDQLKTNTALQMKDAAIAFKTI